jgi:hypothetical protein
MRTPAVIMIAVLLLVKSATAQTISTYTGQPQVSAFGVDPTIRIAGCQGTGRSPKGALRDGRKRMRSPV